MNTIIKDKFSDEVREVQFDLSRKGLPCVWERGGGYSNTGEVQLVADTHGNPKPCMYVRTHGQLACDNHILFKANVGDVLMQVSRWHNVAEVEIIKIISIGADGKAKMRDVHLNDDFANMLDAAIAKSYDYHCREGYYYVDRFAKQNDPESDSNCLEEED